MKHLQHPPFKNTTNNRVSGPLERPKNVQLNSSRASARHSVHLHLSKTPIREKERVTAQRCQVVCSTQVVLSQQIRVHSYVPIQHHQSLPEVPTLTLIREKTCQQLTRSLTLCVVIASQRRHVLCLRCICSVLHAGAEPRRSNTGRHNTCVVRWSSVVSITDSVCVCCCCLL